ncbi:SDR family NAD(P)-dependent oxidoreductase [soil metagenome]
MTEVLKDRVAVVTGAGQGIGRSIAERFAKEGAHVAVVDINEELTNETTKIITDAGGSAIAVVCDVSSREAVNAAAAKTVEQFGPISILVSNAGITRPAMLWKMTDEQFDLVHDVHVKGSFYWLQAVTPAMREARAGNIIFTTSGAGLIGSVGQINYSVAKAGLLGMTRSAARELAPYDIVVNAVAPAAATPMTETIRTDERFKEKYLEGIPMNRWAEPDEIAGTYVYLAGPDCSYLTGQCLSVDGGRTMVR